jgi:aconitate hydratase
MPLIFKNPEDFDRIQAGDELEITDTMNQFRKPDVTVTNRIKKSSFIVGHALTPRQVEIVLCGGLLNYVGQLQSRP